ncbi:Linocin_M18 bacteriocin protein [Alkaliphilus metalliredigens QYMF]|uniref:Type 1 encapsulin shell protein n=1 Tax=Alkaliphilus metalliredigens (strain QYMF) TaxID=293826 RepID=A6TWC5_ALKMQ|nr:family 1 encapsulin nanocompartment shell protein [Alkaliphilus metalliredigens]ABR50493.1 Linocin_M18 bacteriocin protein [Alkaliphilus metalliredigens QYMF]
MDILKRDMAPLTESVWEEIDQRAAEVLKTHLSARRVVNIVGPKGWDYTVVPEGRLKKIEDNPGNVCTGMYQVKPLVEARISFKLDRWEMDNLIRGAKDIKLDALEEAAEKMAIFEENMLYNGYKPGDIEGLIEASSHKLSQFGNNGEEIMENLAQGMILLKEAYVDQPVTLVVGIDAWKRINREMQGHPLINRIQELTGSKVIYSPVVEGALLLPYDHEDLELTIGRDFSIGYEYHDAKTVQLFITESLTFRALNPDIIVVYNI